MTTTDQTTEQNADTQDFNQTAADLANTPAEGNGQPTAEQVAAVETEPAEDALFTFKKKSYFDGTVCGLKGCARKLTLLGSYVMGTKPTKNNDNGRLWFGPACEACVTKAHGGMKPATLAELAHQRQGASDLALVLDCEVGDIQKRLITAGIDENGRPIVASATAAVVPLGDTVKLETVSAEVPTALLATENTAIAQTLQFLGTFHIQAQQDMDNAGGWLQMVKSKWKDFEETKKALAKPHRDMASHISAQFKPLLDALKMAEGLLKQKIAEGKTRAQEAQQTALLAAQTAHQAGDMQAAGLAAQQVAASDVTVPSNIIQYAPVVKFEMVDPRQLPTDFWSPDLAKIQAAIDAGHRQIPGVRIWEEARPLGSRAS